MKSLLRNLLINSGSLWLTAQIIPGLIIESGVRGLLIGAIAFMIINLLLVPLIRVLLLPLNLLTLGIFAWLTNVLALYFLVAIVPAIKIVPYTFPGSNVGGIIFPMMSFSTFWVTVLVSFIMGVIIHFIFWLLK